MRLSRTDANQKEVVEAFRKLGCSVVVTSRLRNGVPDICVGLNGWNVWIEIKDGSKVPSKRKLTEDEQKWHEAWRGWVEVVESVDDVVALVNRMKSKAA